jgi:hypothetical protein
MNTYLLDIVNRIVAEQGEDILSAPARLKPIFSDYAKSEYKEDRIAFGRCIEYGAYQELKKTRTPDERQRLKATLVDQINAKTGVDRPHCASALDLLEMVMFKTVQQSTPVPSQANVCSKCGKELQKEWTSCPYCSTPVAKVGIQTNWQESLKPEIPVYSNNLQTQPPVQPETSASSGNTATPKTEEFTRVQNFFVFLVTVTGLFICIKWNLSKEVWGIENIFFNTILNILAGFGFGVLLSQIFSAYNKSKRKKS